MAESTPNDELRSSDLSDIAGGFSFSSFIESGAHDVTGVLGTAVGDVGGIAEVGWKETEGVFDSSDAHDLGSNFEKYEDQQSGFFGKVGGFFKGLDGGNSAGFATASAFEKTSGRPWVEDYEGTGMNETYVEGEETVQSEKEQQAGYAAYGIATPYVSGEKLTVSQAESKLPDLVIDGGGQSAQTFVDSNVDRDDGLVIFGETASGAETAVAGLDDFELTNSEDQEIAPILVTNDFTSGQQTEIYEDLNQTGTAMLSPDELKDVEGVLTPSQISALEQEAKTDAIGAYQQAASEGLKTESAQVIAEADGQAEAAQAAAAQAANQAPVGGAHHASETVDATREASVGTGGSDQPGDADQVNTNETQVNTSASATTDAGSGQSDGAGADASSAQSSSDSAGAQSAQDDQASPSDSDSSDGAVSEAASAAAATPAAGDGGASASGAAQSTTAQ